MTLLMQCGVGLAIGSCKGILGTRLGGGTCDNCNVGLLGQWKVLGDMLAAGLGGAYKWAGGPVDVVWFGS